jgi:hypothetical protein
MWICEEALAARRVASWPCEVRGTQCHDRRAPHVFCSSFPTPVRTLSTAYPPLSNIRTRRSTVARNVGSCLTRSSTTCIAWITVE